jgi:hypothetical protein
MIDRRGLLVVLTSGALFGSAVASAAVSGELRDMQSGPPGTPAPSPRSPGLGNGGMTPGGATNPGATGSNQGSTIPPRSARRMTRHRRRATPPS